MALGDFKLFKENAGGSFDERTVAAAPGKVFSWDEEYDPVTIDVVPYRMAKDDVDLNGKALVNVANLGVGIAAPDATLHVVREEAGSIVSQNMYVDTAAGAAIQFRKARGSFLSPAAAQNNDVAGGFVAQFYDGSGFGNTAAIRIYATQNQTPTKHGAKIAFETVANDTTTLVERMVIQHDGKVGIGTTDPLDIFHVHNGVNPAHVYFSSSRESAGAAATFNLMNKHTGSYTRFAHRLYGNPLREQSLLTVYDANIRSHNQLLIFDLLDKSLAIGQGAANISLMPSNNVGINTSNPQKTLHVNGDIEASNYYHDNFQGISERIGIVDSAGTHTLTFSGGLLIDYELI